VVRGGVEYLGKVQLSKERAGNGLSKKIFISGPEVQSFLVLRATVPFPALTTPRVRTNRRLTILWYTCDTFAHLKRSLLPTSIFPIEPQFLKHAHSIFVLFMIIVEIKCLRDVREIQVCAHTFSQQKRLGGMNFSVWCGHD
jgi:hypothetical protein